MRKALVLALIASCSLAASDEPPERRPDAEELRAFIARVESYASEGYSPFSVAHLAENDPVRLEVERRFAGRIGRRRVHGCIDCMVVAGIITALTSYIYFSVASRFRATPTG